MRKVQNWRVGLLLGVILTLILAACSGQQDTVAKLQIIGADNLNLEVGETANLSAELVYESGQTVKVTAEWTSSNEAVATVDAGKVTAISAGTANITAKHEPSGKTAMVNVEVNSRGLEESNITVTVSAEATEIFVSQTVAISAVVTGTDDTDVTWSVDPPGILDNAESAGNGLKAEALTAGTVTVTAQSKADAEKHSSIEITVHPIPEFNPAEVFIGGETIIDDNDADKGTVVKPFSTIQEALSSGINPDAVLRLAPGKYFEDETIELNHHQLIGDGSESTEISVQNDCVAVSVTGTDATISGIAIDASQLDTKPPCEWVVGIQALNTEGLEIADVTVTGVEDTDPARNLVGIQLWKTTESTLENITVSHTQRSGIEVSGGIDIMLRNITVANAGQGQGTILEGPGGAELELDIIQSGYGAFGFYTKDSTESIENLVLDGPIILENMVGRVGISVDLNDGHGLGIGFGPNYRWDSDALIPLMLQSDIGIIEPFIGSARNKDVMEAFAVTHGIQMEDAGRGVSATFASIDDALLVGRGLLEATFGQLQLPIEELNLEASAGNELLLRNLVAYQTADGQYSVDLQPLIDLASDPAMGITSGVAITEGTFTEQITISSSINVEGLASDAAKVVLRAPMDMTAVDGLYSIARVTGVGVEATIKNLTLVGEMPKVENCSSLSAALLLTDNAELSVAGLRIVDVGSAVRSACPAVQGIAVGRQGDGHKGGLLVAEDIYIQMATSGKNAVYVDDDEAQVTIIDSKIKGVTTVQGQPGQNGIQVSRGSIALDNSEITGFSYNEDHDDASGLLLWPWLEFNALGHAVIQNSLFTDNDTGIAVLYTNNVVIENTSFANSKTAHIVNASTKMLDLRNKDVVFDGIQPSETTTSLDIFRVVRGLIDGVNLRAGECDIGVPVAPCEDWGPIALVEGHWYVTEYGDAGKVQAWAEPGDVLHLE